MAIFVDRYCSEKSYNHYRKKGKNMEFLKELMGDAYKEGMTKEDVESFFKKQVLASGDYINAGKAKGEKQELNDKIAELQGQLEAKMTDDDKKKKADEDTKKLTVFFIKR